MKLFKLEADAFFYADNIDDAMAKLSEHFKNMHCDDAPPFSIIVEGQIKIKPVKEKPV